MSQPSFVNRYVREKGLYVAHSSSFISMADALDLLIRTGVFSLGYENLPLRHAIVCARTTFDMDPAREPRKGRDRSILAAWLLFFICALGPVRGIIGMKGIPGTKAFACGYALSIVIRAAIDMVPDPIGEDESKDAADEFGLAAGTNRLPAWRARIVSENSANLELCSWMLQTTGLFASVGMVFWIGVAVAKPLIFLKHVPMGSISHFGPWLRHLMLNIVYLVPTFLLVCLFIVVIFACIGGVFLITYALGTSHRRLLCVNAEDLKRIGLYTFALTWMLAGIAFYAGKYDRRGTSKAGVSEALG